MNTYPDVDLLDSVFEGDGSAHLFLEQRIYDSRTACLQSHGYDLMSRRPDAAMSVAERPVWRVLTVAVAEAFGYHNPETLTPPVADTYQEWVDGLTEAERTTYFTVEQQCTEAAQDAAFGGDRMNYLELEQTYQTKKAELFVAIRASGDVDALNQDWMACMTAKGYAYDSPSAAADRFASLESEPSAGPSAEEIDTAVADAGCRAEVGFDDRYRRVVTAYQQRFLDENAALVLELYEAKFSAPYGSSAG